MDGRLTSGPTGSDTYGNSSHPHALTSTSTGYSAAYDAAGNMTCRAPSSAATCSGTQTGQQLSYDAEGRLTSWQNQPSAPTRTASYLYDGAGQRVAMQTTVSGTTTLTAYIGGVEEVQTTGSTTQTTAYYTVAGMRVAANVNGTLYYFGYDALGSQVVVVNSSGSVVGTQLYGPYGSNRYSAGALPTSIGFTGQRADSVTGLDYYVARYYDPVIGMFLAPDSVQGNQQGMDPYTYVSGNPETLTDPMGHCGFGSWGDFGSCLTQGGQIIAQGAVVVGSDIAEAALSFIADWFLPIVIGVGIGILIWQLSHPAPTPPACRCAASSTIADAQAIAIGMGSKPRAWNKEDQKELAKGLSTDAVNDRSKAITKYKTKREGKDPRGSNVAEALLTIMVPGQTPQSFEDFAIGYRDAELADHAEQLLVDWAEKTIKSLQGKLQEGAVINLLIFTQTPPCDEAGGCQAKLTSNTWLNTLYAATGLAGGQAEVNLEVWTTDPNPGNISGIDSFCRGSTNGVTSNNNC